MVLVACFVERAEARPLQRLAVDCLDCHWLNFNSLNEVKGKKVNKSRKCLEIERMICTALHLLLQTSSDLLCGTCSMHSLTYFLYCITGCACC